MAQDKACLQTYLSLIQSGAERLKASQIETPYREARLIMRLAAGLTYSELIAQELEALENPAIEARYEALIARRADHEPFAYLSGQQEFYGFSYLSDPRALIPRADSECLIELIEEIFPDQDQPLTVADLGTGSGCLLISLLNIYTKAVGIAVEKDADALALAKENSVLHRMRARLQFCHMDWAEWTGWDQLDLIISNPPYIKGAEIDTLPRSVRDYEPRQALDGGADGLEAYREIINLCHVSLKPGAWLVFEVGHDQSACISKLLEGQGFHSIRVRKDLAGHERAVAACKTAT